MLTTAVPRDPRLGLEAAPSLNTPLLMERSDLGISPKMPSELKLVDPIVIEPSQAIVSTITPIESDASTQPASRKRALILYLATAAISAIVAGFQFRKVQSEREKIPALINSALEAGKVDSREAEQLNALHTKSPGIFRGLINDMKVMGYLADNGIDTGKSAIRALAVGLGFSATALSALGAAAYTMVTGDVVSPVLGLGSLITTTVLTPLGLNGLLRHIGHSAAQK